MRRVAAAWDVGGGRVGLIVRPRRSRLTAFVFASRFPSTGVVLAAAALAMSELWFVSRAPRRAVATPHAAQPANPARRIDGAAKTGRAAHGSPRRHRDRQRAVGADRAGGSLPLGSGWSARRRRADRQLGRLIYYLPDAHTALPGLQDLVTICSRRCRLVILHCSLGLAFSRRPRQEPDVVAGDTGRAAVAAAVEDVRAG